VRHEACCASDGIPIPVDATHDKGSDAPAGSVMMGLP